MCILFSRVVMYIGSLIYIQYGPSPFADPESFFRGRGSKSKLLTHFTGGHVLMYLYYMSVYLKKKDLAIPLSQNNITSLERVTNGRPVSNMFYIGRVAMTRVDKRWILLSHIVREVWLELRAKRVQGRRYRSQNIWRFSLKKVMI